MHLRFLAVLVAGLMVPAAHAAPLTQDQAVALALAAQPQLAARAATVQSLREDALAAGELPDPRLSFGLQNVPTDNFNLTSESMTQAMVGVSQMLPGGDKRALNRKRMGRQAGLAESDLALARRQIERDVRLAWLDLWLPSQSLNWLRDLGLVYEQQIAWAEVAYKAGKLGRDQILQWQAQREGVRDRESGERLALERARAQLRRWLGNAAQDDAAADPPAPFNPGDVADERIDLHPELQRARHAVEVARADAALAREANKPDWNVNLAYGARGGGRADLLSLQVDMDLPVFPANRQDRRLAARLAEVNQASEEREDKRRGLLAELHGTQAERLVAAERIARFERDILPLQASREAAALADYRAGKGSWDRVLDARRDILETRMQWLAQRDAQARADVQLRYLLGSGQ